MNLIWWRRRRKRSPHDKKSWLSKLLLMFSWHRMKMIRAFQVKQLSFLWQDFRESKVLIQKTCWCWCRTRRCSKSCNDEEEDGDGCLEKRCVNVKSRIREPMKRDKTWRRQQQVHKILRKKDFYCLFGLVLLLKFSWSHSLSSSCSFLLRRDFFIPGWWWWHQAFLYL